MLRTYVVTVDDKDESYDFEAILEVGMDSCGLWGSDEFEILSVTKLEPTVGSE